MKRLMLVNMARAIVFLLAAFYAAPSLANDSSGYIVSNDIAIYYAIVPAQILRGHDKSHPEATMHGGVPKGKHERHLMIALFDDNSAARIEDAEVTATIAEVGLAGQTKTLEPFTVSGALTYGNYFEMDNNTLYSISVSIKTPKHEKPVQIKFESKHF
ncbi:MAG: hypothetical protein ACOY99_08375 [Pseudomonadota bacterium]